VAVTTIALGATLAAASAAWRAIPWTRTHAELRATKEPLPPHERVAGVWWSDEGWAIAAGPKGEVLLREAEPRETEASSWRVLPPVTSSDLDVVAGGEFHGKAHALVAGDGVLLDCTPSGCAALATGVHPRAIAVASDEALVVADEGAARVVVWFSGPPYSFPSEPAARLVAHRITDLPVTSDLRAVDLSCTADGPGRDTCHATLIGAEGVRIHGVRTGTCDDGRTSSGHRINSCNWTWQVRHEPEATPPEPPVGAWSPVTVMSTKLTARREERERARLWFGPSPTADIDGTVLPLRVERRFVAAATQYGGLGAATLLLDDAGDVYLAR
jgi:hypothetical protein